MPTTQLHKVFVTSLRSSMQSIRSLIDIEILVKLLAKLLQDGNWEWIELG